MPAPIPDCARPVLVSVFTAAALGLAGCGVNQGDHVRAKVKEFATAVARHDYRAICRDVLAPTLLNDIANGGLSCEKALSLGLASVHNARLVLGTVSVSGSRASVVTVTQAGGERAALATLELTHTPAGWRIASLGNVARGGVAPAG